MKISIIFSSLCFLFLNSACQNQTVLSQQSENSQNSVNLKNSNQSSETTSNAENFYIEEIVNDKEFLTVGDYKIKKIITKKRDEEWKEEEADITDAILEKNGKRIFKFEGDFYPAGNFMEFGLFPLTNSKEKDLLVFDSSNRYGRLWIVNFENGAKQIFDSEGWDGFREFINFVDLDGDKVYEFTMVKYDYAGFESLAHIDTPMSSIIFKFDPNSGKYLPANYKYRDIAREIVEKQNLDKVKNNLAFRPMLENFFKLIYAGMEKEAWDYFEENYNFPDSYENGLNTNSNIYNSKKVNISEETKQKVKIQIENALKKDKIYQFVKSEVSKNN